MNVQEAIDQYVAERKRNGSFRPGTARTIRYMLGHFADYFGPDRDPATITQADAVEWLSSRPGAARTIRGRASCVRGLYRWLMMRGAATVDPFLGYDLVRPPRAVPRALEARSVGALLEVCDDSRDRLMVSLMVQEGLRVGEVTVLDMGDVDLAARTLLVHGKGGHERMLPITVETKKAMVVYLADMPPTTNGRLLRSHKDGRSGLTVAYLSTRTVMLMTRAGVKSRPYDGVSAHALRHTAASDVFTRSGNLRTVQDFLGHSSIMTTQVYLRRASAAALREAVEGRDYRRPA